MKTPSEWGRALRLSVGESMADNQSAHCYRTLRGIQVYVWVRGRDGQRVCASAKIGFADLERYVTEAHKVKRARNAKATP